MKLNNKVFKIIIIVLLAALITSNVFNYILYKRYKYHSSRHNSYNINTMSFYKGHIEVYMYQSLKKLDEIISNKKIRLKECKGLKGEYHEIAVLQQSFISKFQSIYYGVREKDDLYKMSTVHRLKEIEILETTFDTFYKFFNGLSKQIPQSGELALDDESIEKFEIIRGITEKVYNVYDEKALKSNEVELKERVINQYNTLVEVGRILEESKEEEKSLWD